MGLGAAIGGIAGGLLSSKSAGDAADAQTAAAQMQVDLEREIYNDTTQRFEPYYQGGMDFQNALRYELLGGPTPTFGGSAPGIRTETRTVNTGGNRARNKNGSPLLWGDEERGDLKSSPGTRNATYYYVGDKRFGSREGAQNYADAHRTGGYEYQGFQETPGYQFALDQGQAAIDGSAAARGNVFSGATLKAQQEYGQGLANQEYGNYLNRLTGQASQGMSAAGNLATAGANYASGAGNAYANMGNAQSAGIIGQGNALTSGLNSAISAYGYMNPQLTASNGVTIPNSLMQSVNGLF